MKISTKGRYALRVMADIALSSDDKNVSIMELSSRNSISDKYLEQIISLMVKNNLLLSFRGSQGGYKLSRPANEITIGEIMKAAEGNFETVSCINSNEKCDKADMCLTVNVWAKLDKIVNDFFNSTTLDDVIHKRVL
ncbi:MAG: Rrf2 family transcriptional regulator [Clostridia bacterium]|nr:Rrf2 family transcriptional regulator [Clostridia bacterium]